MSQDKFLVELFQRFTKTDLFIVAWVTLGIVPFLYLWWLDHKKSSQRNFKEPARQASKNPGGSIVKAEDSTKVPTSNGKTEGD